VDILTNYPDVNLEWLLMGKGSMLRNEEYSTPADKNLVTDEPSERYDSEYWKNEYITVQKKYTALLENKLQEVFTADKRSKAG
jgi:hypothetical protein